MRTLNEIVIACRVLGLIALIAWKIAHGETDGVIIRRP